VSFVVEKRQLPPPEGEIRRRPALATGIAKVREGERGDWGITVWMPTQAEAQDLARLINDRLRKPTAEAVEP
jgi:hypothetical protein